jgi:hypothetical protein
MPTPTFSLACIQVLGDDSDATVLPVLMGDDRELIAELLSAHDEVVAVVSVHADIANASFPF